MRYIENLDEIKNIEFKVLLAIDDFCKKEGINYYLIYGTLLGAKRHQGFIPWDDDIDIAMPRKEYERFISVFSMDGFKCLSIDNSEEYFYPFAKVYDEKTLLIEEGRLKYNCGIYVDVFPIDRIPVKNELLFRKKIWFMQHILMNKYADNYDVPMGQKIKRIVLKVAGIPFSARNLGIRINKLCKSEKFARSKKTCANLVWGEVGEKFPIEQFQKPAYLEFERKMFPCPENVDAYLKTIYGDYKKLPPVEKRVCKHSFKAYYLD